MLRADWSIEVGALRFRSATLTQLEEAGRGHLTGEAADAESLAVTGEDLLISFERDHRILRQTSAGDLVPWAVPDGIEDLGSNSGIEALVGLGDGRVLAIAEDVIEGAAPLWLFRDGTIETRGSLSLASHHRVTAAALGPSGALYLTRRSYSVVDGVSIRIERFALKNGLPDPATRRELAAFESESGIDNIEGLALVEETPGVTALWAIADDNFNPLQRTVLLRFVLKGRP
ncbi:MAG: esterase-like activity of phytase family protein [Pseudomonadota bacterium]